MHINVNAYKCVNKHTFLHSAFYINPYQTAKSFVGNCSPMEVVGDFGH